MASETDIVMRVPGASDPGTGEVADPAGVRLIENFSRVVFLFMAEPGVFPQAEGMIESSTLDDGQSKHLVWRALPRALKKEQTEFFLPSVSQYFQDAYETSENRFRTLLSFQIALGNPAPDAKFEGIQGASRSLSDVDPPLDLSLVAWRDDKPDKYGEFLVTLAHLELYLFSTGIGAMVFDFGLTGWRRDKDASWQEPTLGMLSRFNYLATRTEADRMLRFRFGGDQDLGKAVQCLLNPLMPPRSDGGRQAGATLQRLVEHLKPPVRIMDPGGENAFFNERRFKVQTFAKVPETLKFDGLLVDFYRLRRVHKETYLPPPEDLAADHNAAIVRAFEQITVGMSLEGMAVLVCDSKGSDFFKHILTSRLRRGYFAHYLLAVHQRAALLHLGITAGRLPQFLRKRPQGSDLEKIMRLREETIDFNLHHRFGQVSNGTLLARVYDAMLGALGVPQLLDEVRDKISEIDTYVRQESEREERHRERRLAQLVAVMGPIGILTGYYGMNLPTVPKFPGGGWQSPNILIPVLVCAVAIAVATVMAHQVDILSKARRVGKGKPGS